MSSTANTTGQKIFAKPSCPEQNGISPYRDVNIEQLQGVPEAGVGTLTKLFQRSVAKYPNNRCLGTRELLREEEEQQSTGKIFKKLILGKYKWLTYREVDTKIQAISRGLTTFGIQPKDKIAICAETRAEWLMSAHAALANSVIVVTVYATLGEDALIHAINETEVSLVIVDENMLQKFTSLSSKMPTLKTLIYFGKSKDTSFLDSARKDIQIKSLQETEEIGLKSEGESIELHNPSAEDISVIMYTSGSTGMPKGVVISHSNLVGATVGMSTRYNFVRPHDSYIGYLPLAHVLELAAENTVLSVGAAIGYSSPNTLSDQSTGIKKGCKGDLSELQPTVMAAVPTIMDRIRKAVYTKVNGGNAFTKALFNFAYNYKMKQLSRGGGTPLLDRLVFSKTRKLLGGKIKVVLSGGAPLSTETQKFMNICLCCPVGQGYGLTETCGAGTMCDVTDLSSGRVGAPLVCNEIKLIDWPEGGYTTHDKPYPRGEICISGHNVTVGYYKNEEKTRESYVEMDGKRWFMTGDIGEWHPDGCLKVIDRRKDLVKLQAGEYVSLGKVEAILKGSNFIDNICVYAESDKDYIIGFVVPTEATLRNAAGSLNIDTKDWEELCKSEKLQQKVIDDLHRVAKIGKLQKFEVPRKIKLCSDLWTPESELVTAALKLRRHSIKQFYINDIKQMYT
ncbi:Long-chain-fatty-acid--CoA ligase 4 [Trichoplax sp. H2]|nr:Long-chain-fatty-acid--CoA ligase 4 [Trichoplax sp. H2]|eukprot:RDD38466.1 Long-chain-fatty-acid--CoA ligase 4 [Trichoplax sp. H2]